MSIGWEADDFNESCRIVSLFLTPQAISLKRFPLHFLILVQLTRQRFYWNVVQRAEMTPEKEAHVVLPGLFRNSVVYWRFFRLSLVHTFFALPA